MNTKAIYIKPQILCIELDNEISLALESPPEGPNEALNFVPDYFNNNPLKISNI